MYGEKISFFQVQYLKNHRGWTPKIEDSFCGWVNILFCDKRTWTAWTDPGSVQKTTEDLTGFDYCIYKGNFRMEPRSFKTMVSGRDVPFNHPIVTQSQIAKDILFQNSQGQNQLLLASRAPKKQTYFGLRLI